MDYREYISVDPAIRSGKHCVRGTRIAVFDVLDYLAGGMTPTQIVDDFPQLTEDSIRAFISYAAGVFK